MRGGDFLPVVVPRFDPTRLHEIDDAVTCRDFQTMEFDDVVSHARRHPYLVDPRTLPSVVVGAVPYEWYMFVGWMHAHRLLHGGHVGRVGVHFRAVETPVVVANLKFKRNHRNWVDRRVE